MKCRRSLTVITSNGAKYKKPKFIKSNNFESYNLRCDIQIVSALPSLNVFVIVRTKINFGIE